MSDTRTAEQCRVAQRECAHRIFDEINSLRKDQKEDIKLIRDAVQTIDRSVSAIRGYLGLNGNAGDLRESAHLHKRNTDEIEHLHKRITDLIEAAKEQSEAAVAAALAVASKDATKSEQSITIPRWVLVPVGVFIVIMLAIAMVAGERGLTFLPKQPAQTNVLLK